MEIFLIRHTTPLVEKGTCYGQTDLDVTDSFLLEADIIKTHLSDNIQAIYSSPLQRCKKLAQHLFPHNPINLHNDLMELNCGSWEMQKWDDIPKHEIDPWMNDFVTVSTPQGESYIDLHDRVVACFEQIIQHGQSAPSDEIFRAGIVAHGGVIRSILSHITQTALVDSFTAFKLHYGCVVKINYHNKNFQHTVLHNVAPEEKEQHKPSYFKFT
jgi:alpha-ribazole phosphatase